MQIKGPTCFPFGFAALYFPHLSHLAKQSDLAGKRSVGRKALMALATFPGTTAPQFDTGEFRTQRSQEWSQSITDKLYLLEITGQGEAKDFNSPFSNCCYSMLAMLSCEAAILNGKVQHLNAIGFARLFFQILAACLAR